MLFHDLNFFVQGWRGFLVGQPRGWHAHHRSEIQGYRAGWLLPRETLQVAQLRRAASFTVELLARGGQLWGFGFGGVENQTPGLTWWARATPGVLSNAFFARARRIPAVRQLRRLILLRYRRRKVRPRIKRRSRRVGLKRRRGGLELFLGRARLLRRVTRLTLLGQHLRRGLKSQLVGTRFPDLVGVSRFTRSGFFSYPRWWTRRTTAKSPRGGYRVWAPRKVIQNFNLQLTRAQLRRTTRVGLQKSRRVLTPGVLIPRGYTPTGQVNPFSPRWYRGYHRGGRRRNPRLSFQPRWVHSPLGLPTAVLVGGALGQTLHREVTRGGYPLLLVAGAEVVPGVGSLYPVLWNEAALQGPRYLWTRLEGLAHRRGLFRLLWNRLTCLAEW